MTKELIEYKSESFDISEDNNIIETNKNKGIICTWKGQLINNCKNIKYSWEFNWDKLGTLIELSGYIILRRPAPEENIRIDVYLTNIDENIEKIITNTDQNEPSQVAFDYYLTTHPNRMRYTPYEEIFKASVMTDAILMVEGKKMHVSKGFLSWYSTYFRTLFTSNFIDEKMDEYPIKDVSYKDFSLLLSIIYPPGNIPNDQTAEKLLELAHRFILRSVIGRVEHQLLMITELSNEKLMWLADKYSMPKLLKGTIRATDSVEKMKKVKESPGYNEFSDKTKAALFERVMQFA